MQLRQYTLASFDETINGYRTETCWLEDGRAKDGDYLTLKDSDEPDRLWKVLKTFSAVDSSHINRGWKNNI